MRHPMIVALLGLIGSAMETFRTKAPRPYSQGTYMRRGRTGATTGRSINGMRQSDNPRLAHLRGFAGAKMARKAEQHTLGLRHGA